MNSVDTPDVIRGVGGESGIKVKSYSVKKKHTEKWWQIYRAY